MKIPLLLIYVNFREKCGVPHKLCIMSSVLNIKLWGKMNETEKKIVERDKIHDCNVENSSNLRKHLELIDYI